MEAISRDDEQALTRLVQAVGPSILRFVRRTVGGSTAEAEDIVQEVFIRVWKARRRWRPESAVTTYLYTIAARLCMNRIRGWRRAPSILPLSASADEPEIGVCDGSPDPERMAISGKLREFMEREIDALPPGQKAALLLRHSEDLSQQEIARVLEVSVAAVESLLSRARARLRSRLAPWVAEGTTRDRG